MEPKMAKLQTIYHLAVKKVWTPWGEWGACSVTCGGGGQRRYRSCMTKTIYGHHSGTVNHCTGSSYRKRRCNTQCCPGKLYLFQISYFTDLFEYILIILSLI